ncbi:MAG: ABC transporter ATP-binding protein/permease, partial [Legionellales bacterium]
SLDNNYLDLMRQSKQLRNPEQRIQEDVESFVTNTLTLGLELFRSVVSLAVFVGSLWVIGGSLSVVVFGATLIIPGYLVWVALSFALMTSALAQLIGSSLADLNKEKENLEADYRTGLQVLNGKAESIAQEHGEVYYKKALTAKFQEITANSYRLLNVKIKLSAFQDLCGNIPFILPYIASAPLYFMGQIEFAQLMLVGTSFIEVNNSLGWFVKLYEILAVYKANVARISELEYALSGGLQCTKKDIVIIENDLDEIRVEQLNIAEPSSTHLIMQGLHVRFKAKEHTLITGTSGLGKSTLFKVISGSWRYGTGRVHVPYNQMRFLPQVPVLPEDTLRAVLAYPDPENTYTDEQLIAALRDVGNMDKFIPKLDQKSSWSTTLSPGEQQRISFARALLKKPQWLFLDEASASLDTVSEERLYTLLQTQLKDTTLISIAHRPSVAKFHQRVVLLEPHEGNSLIKIIEKRPDDVANMDFFQESLVRS